MFIIIIAVFFTFYWCNVYATLPPEKGTCINSFIDINPLDLMEQWVVVKHTDNLLPPVQDGCLSIKFGRRVNFGKGFRMDVIIQVKDDESDMMVDSLVMRADVTSKKEEPFLVSKHKVPNVFPPTIMVTKMVKADNENQCFAAWTCADFKNSVQKAAWVACKSPVEMDEDTLNSLAENLIEQSKIDPSYLIPTKYKKCTF